MEYNECLAMDDGFICTLEPEHDGDHVAEDIYDEVVHTWPKVIES